MLACAQYQHHTQLRSPELYNTSPSEACLPLSVAGAAQCTTCPVRTFRHLMMYLALHWSPGLAAPQICRLAPQIQERAPQICHTAPQFWGGPLLLQKTNGMRKDVVEPSSCRCR